MVGSKAHIFSTISVQVSQGRGFAFGYWLCPLISVVSSTISLHLLGSSWL